MAGLPPSSKLIAGHSQPVASENARMLKQSGMSEADAVRAALSQIRTLADEALSGQDQEEGAEGEGADGSVDSLGADSELMDQ